MGKSHATLLPIIDVHAHILPGVDDGARNMEESMQMLHMAYRQGVSKIIATPHFRFIPDKQYYGNEKERLSALCRELEEKGRAMGMKVRIYLGQEILYFDGMTEYLENGWALTLGGSRYVLIEFPPLVAFATILRAVQTLERGGYLVVLAHIERYSCLREPGKLQALSEEGALFQMNYECFSGKLFDRGARWCRKQVLEGRIHLLGTDMHREDRRKPNVEPFASCLMRKAPELAWKVLHQNPAQILNGEMILND